MSMEEPSTNLTPGAPAPEAPAPRSFGDLLSESLSTYGGALAVLTGIALAALVPLALFEAAAWAAREYTGTDDTLSAAQDLIFPLGTIGLNILIHPVMMGALIHAAARRHDGRATGVLDAYSCAMGTAGRLIGAYLLMLVMLMLVALPFLVFFAVFAVLGAGWVWLGMLLLLVGVPLAAYFGVKWMLVFQAVLLEGSGPWEGLKRSSALVSGHWWRSFGFFLLISVLPSLILGLAVRAILSAASVGGFAGTVVQGLIPGLFTTPLSAVSMTILYFDLRARKLPPSPQPAAGEADVPPFGAPAPPGPEPDPPTSMPAPPPPGAPPQAAARPRLRLALVLVTVAVVLAAAVASVFLWQRGRADDREFRVWVESLSTERRVEVSGGAPEAIEFTDFAIVVECAGTVEAAGEENTVVISRGDTREEVRVRVFARAGTVDDLTGDPVSHLPELDPANELGVEVGIMDEHQILVSSPTGSFPAASQIVLSLAYKGDGALSVATVFTA